MNLKKERVQQALIDKITEKAHLEEQAKKNREDYRKQIKQKEFEERLKKKKMMEGEAERLRILNDSKQMIIGTDC